MILLSCQAHEHHKGLSDSIFRENTLQARFYQQLKAAGLYIHAPDSASLINLAHSHKLFLLFLPLTRICWILA